VVAVEPDRRALFAALAARDHRSRPRAAAAAAAGRVLDHFRLVSKRAQLGDQSLPNLRVVRASDWMRRLVAEHALVHRTRSPCGRPRRRWPIADRGEAEEREDRDEARVLHGWRASSSEVA